MGESLVEALNVKDKMGESVGSVSAIEVSVSFGRFDNESLSWEKWSTFSPNKYLEEVEKCSTPGSVAQKKAYFEAHYKKIAAQKAELLEQEKNLESDTVRSDDSNCEDHSEITCGNATEFGISNGQSIPRGVEYDTSLISAENSVRLGTSNEDAAIARECQTTPVVVTKEEMCRIPVLPESPKLSRLQETVLVQEDTHLERSQDMMELAMRMDKENENSLQNEEEENSKLGASEKTEETILVQEHAHLEGSQHTVELPKIDKVKENSLQNREENANLWASEKSEKTVLAQEDAHPKRSQDMVELPRNLDKKKGNRLQNKEDKAKMGASKISQKITPARKEKNLAGSIKKAASPVLKSPKISASKLTKPTSISTIMSATRSSPKNTNNSSLTRGKTPSTGESKRAAPKSLHMSLCLGPANSDSTTSTTTRKSQIMEKMGDKDIVKRVFKSFQKKINSTDEISSGPKQGPERKVSTSGTPRKENDRIRKVAEKLNAERGQSGQKWKSASLGSPKRASVGQRNAKVVPSPFSLRSDERAEKRKEFSKKLEKSNTKETERTRANSKSKEGKEAEVKMLRHSLNFKATPTPVVHQGQRTSKVALVKDSGKSEVHSRSE